jgi:hypothetical protein
MLRGKQNLFGNQKGRPVRPRGLNGLTPFRN